MFNTFGSKSISIHLQVKLERFNLTASKFSKGPLGELMALEGSQFDSPPFFFFMPSMVGFFIFGCPLVKPSSGLIAGEMRGADGRRAVRATVWRPSPSPYRPHPMVLQLAI